MTPGQDSAAGLWRTYSYNSLRALHAAEAGRAFLVPGGLLTVGGIPVPDVNWAYVYGPDEPVETLRTLVDRLRATGLPGHVVAPAELGERLDDEAGRLGLRPCEAIPLMLTQPGVSPPPPDTDGPFRVARITDEVTFDAALDVLAAAFDDEHGHVRQLYRPLLLHLPDVRLFGAFAGDEMVSFCESSMVGGVAWLTDVGTRPDRRGQGAASALLRGVMDWWSGQACERFGLTADPAAQHLYETLGFRVAAMARLWLLDDASGS